MATRLPEPSRAERADAARNRERILAAAERLFAERGAESVTMDEVAQAAGVGKGTLFRRFGDRAGLALAVLGARERELQEMILRGPPPLGPGAPPAERLAAFMVALAGLVERHADVLLVAESGTGARYRSAVYAVYRTHVRHLVAEARPEVDAELWSDALLAPLRADLYRTLRGEREMNVERIAAGLQALARDLLRP